MSKYTTETFIQKAIEIHGNKYDYSKVEYINARTKVIIICKIHSEEFVQNSNSHLQGSGCKKCGFANRKKKLVNNNQIFINKAIEVHGNRYDYSEVEYDTIKNKVSIICIIHGLYVQKAHSHLQGSGCKKCSLVVRYLDRKLNINDFINRSNIIHNYKYDYSNVEYINNHSKIKIGCPIHSLFYQRPLNHLEGDGCIKCGNLQAGNKKRSNINDFIFKAKKIHNDKYDYSKFEYVSAMVKGIIICTKCDKYFVQSPDSHINSKSGCPNCIPKYSKAQIIWLELLSQMNNIYIQHAINDGEFRIPTTKFKADGYCKETNTIYEFNGSYHHSDPRVFDHNTINKLLKKTHKEVYDKTLKKEQIIKDLGYNLVVMWEYDWNKINKSIKKLQKQFKQKYIN